YPSLDTGSTPSSTSRDRHCTYQTSPLACSNNILSCSFILMRTGGGSTRESTGRLESRRRSRTILHTRREASSSLERTPLLQGSTSTTQPPTILLTILYTPALARTS